MNYTSQKAEIAREGALPIASSALEHSRRPFVFFAHGVGDCILAMPTFRALIDIFGKKLTILTRGRAPYARFFQCLEPHQEIHLISGSQKDWASEEIERVGKANTDCDLFLSLVPWSSPSLVALLQHMRPALSVGFSSDFDIELLIDTSKHTAELMFDAVRTVRPGLRLLDYAYPVRFSEEHSEFVASVRSSLTSGTRLLVIHTETLEYKMWRRRRFSEFADAFLTNHPEFIAIVVDLKPWEWHVGAANQKRLLSLPGLSLEDALSLAQLADLFVGIDSCVLHSADLASVPSVGLFGPTSTVEFGFLISPHLAIQASPTLDSVSSEFLLEAAEWMLKNPTERTTWNV